MLADILPTVLPLRNALDLPWYHLPPDGVSPPRQVKGVSPKLDVIGLGENSVDRVLVVPHLPGAPDAPSKMRVSAAVRSCGGQVATAMTACAALGLRAAYAGAIGDDADGRLVLETLAALGVDVTHLLTSPGAATRSAIVLVDASTGDRAVLWDRDDALTLTAAQVDTIDVTTARLVHVDDTDLNASIRLARAARAADRLVTTDIDAARNVSELLTLATHPILSEHALASLSGERDPERGLRALRRHCSGVLCVTLGARGAMALDGDTLLIAPGIQVTPVDTTGAGDVFRAGFITALLGGRTLADTLRFANAAAALSCARVGAIGGVPTLHDVNAFAAAAAR
jgi:sulfofructose kinase